MTNTAKYHTVVLHRWPDAEALFLLFLCWSFASVRERIGLADKFEVKFINSGELRRADWLGALVITAPALEDEGYLFLDCGGTGATFNQHGRVENQQKNKISSLWLVAAALCGRLEELVHCLDSWSDLGDLPSIEDLIFDECSVFPLHLCGVAVRIHDQDISAKALTTDTDFRNSSTPNTARVLTSFIRGLNTLHSDDQQPVIEAMITAFTGINQLALDNDALEEGERRASVGSFFFMPNVIYGVQKSCSCAEATAFEAVVEAALQRWEQEWHTGVADYKKARVNIIPLRADLENRLANEDGLICIISGQSDSQRFGDVCRYGNYSDNPRRSRPYPDLSERPRAGIVVQYYSTKKFQVTSAGTDLTDVAAELRFLDLKRKNVHVPIRAALKSAGNLIYNDRTGKEVTTLFLPEYRKQVGDGFRTNDGMTPTGLPLWQILEVTIAQLSDPDRRHSARR